MYRHHDAMNQFGTRLEDPQHKQAILLQIRKWWNSFECNMFPGPQPISIERSHISQLSNSFYWVCAKTDGLRYIFACLTHNKKPLVLLVNRKSDMFLLDLELPVDAYKGTVLDGEMVKNKHGFYEYLVYDCVIYNGISQINEYHFNRIKAAQSICFSIKTVQEPPFHIHTKVFYPYTQMKQYIRYVAPYLSHNTDGYIFTPNEDPIKSGTHTNMFKWKEQAKNTVDFVIEPNLRRSHDHPCPFVMKISKGKHLTILSFATFFNPRALTITGRTIVECKYNGNDVWEGLLIRHDKNHPNSFLTYQKTLLNIQENIQLEEFQG